MSKRVILLFFSGIVVIAYKLLTLDNYSYIKNLYNKVLSRINSRTEKIYIGFAQQQVTRENINLIEAQVQHPYLIVETYNQWGNIYNSKITTDYLKLFDKANKIPMITWEPWDPTKGTNQPDFKLKKIINGYYDKYIATTANDIHSYGKPVFLRFAHEMNSNWYPWCGTVNQNTPQDYVEAWRHVHTIFLNRGVENVTWVWSPNVSEDDPKKYYPGDAYVDWVGLDGYNWGKSEPNKAWQSFSDIFLDDYLSIISFTNKPIMIAETASTEAGGSKSDWILDAYGTQIPKFFPRVMAVVWFNVNQETNWSIDSSKQSLLALNKSLSLKTYASHLTLDNGKISLPQ